MADPREDCAFLCAGASALNPCPVHGAVDTAAPADVQLRDAIADAIHGVLRDTGHVLMHEVAGEAADAVIAALAGRLQPAGEVEWAWDCGERALPHPHLGPESWAREIAPRIWPAGHLMRRRATGPWRPVPTEGAEA